MSEEIRNPMQMSTNLFIDTVKQEYEAGQRYCFILGSGASYNPDDGIKSGEKMMVEWRNYLLNKGLDYIKECANTTEGGWDKCRHIFENKDYKLKNDDYFTLYDLRFIGKPISGYNYLEKEMENKKPNVGYYYLSGILNNMAGNNLVITTNFDSLTEDAIFHCYGKHPLIIGHEKLASYVQNVTDKPIVAKIHRDLLLGPLNRSNELERLQGEWEENLRTVLSRYVPIVVGYAGGDQTLMQLLKKIKLKGIFWCELEGRDICDAAKEIVCNNNGFRVRIDGFDGLMYRLALAWGGHPDPEDIKARYNEICEDYANKHEMFVEKYKNISFVVSSGEPPTPETVETARTVNKETNKTESEQNVTIFDALTKYAEKKFEEAIEILNELIIRKADNADYFFIRGNILDDLEQYEDAISDYNKVIELKPDDAYAFNNRGVALDNLKRYEDAISDYNKVIELKPDDAHAFNNRGIALRNLERYEDAISDYNKAIELKPDYAYAFNNRGSALSALDRYEEAISDYNKAIELKPDYAGAFNNRGDALRNLGRYEEALSDCNKSIEIASDYEIAYCTRGEVFYDLGRYEEALLDYNKAIEINPDLSDFYSYRAKTFRKLGRNKEASADEAKVKELSEK